MTHLPSVSGRECIGAPVKVGFEVVRQKGSHIILRRNDPYAQIAVPDHRELDRGTLRGILRHASLDFDEFVDLL